ncbi:YcgN family cysteine cluster protein [Temperatibacter marinus]|uniref:UPF0260 protein QGN29_07090 n=1 Tax=Temperatibacter marinus TaxID=1456591 RepID=A0AA52ELC7_9PROT|nr:YcgN family cysteine cluster protein [Temperatibacter marinus]WND04136.1 YcgN family cysteine cluster protein [Temperatibacter marinus]
MTSTPSYWEEKTLEEMTNDEWESLCDGCGKCCLHKMEDEETGTVHVTNVACRLLNLETALCSNYANRKRFVANCAVLTRDKIDSFKWLPNTCAYRLLAEGKSLYEWHPLISGSHHSVKEAGMSVIGRVVDERVAGDFEDHLVEWPLQDHQKT